MDRAYSLLEIKSVTPERRTFAGIASTPELDRQGDIVDPASMRFRNPVPLLFHHDQTQPIGTAILTATADGILFEASLPVIDEPGPLKTRVDDAWQCIRAGVLTGVSIGLLPVKRAFERLSSGARKVTNTEICELSLVTIPANANATIRLVKSLAAPPRQEKRMATQTAAEHVTALENKRAALTARMIEIMNAAADAGETTDPAQAEEHDGLAVQVKSIDGDLGRWREIEKLNIAGAVPVPVVAKAAQPFASVSVKSNAPPAQAFTRSVMALVAGRGDSFLAMQHAKRFNDADVELLVKAAVTPGMTTDPTWAGNLVQINQLTGQFIELSRPATILGKIPGLTKVPFNTQVPIQTGGGTYKWVGQAKAKPVGKLTFGAATLGMAKAAGIIVLTDELIKSSSPSAEDIVRRDMVAGIAQFLDQQFTDPLVAEVAQTSPASITNGATTAASLDDPAKDVGLIVTHFNGQNIPLQGLTIIMSSTNAYAMGMSRTAMGVQLFPGVGVNGGNANGLTVIASNVVGQNVIGLAPEYILYADDGGVAIDVSREATLQMNDAPVNPADPATTVWTSLFQDNLTALRAERFINWKRAATPAVYYLTGANYPIG
jgi:HK97 family phage major capsid protein/HK97 family phage prohead protease